MAWIFMGDHRSSVAESLTACKWDLIVVYIAPGLPPNIRNTVRNGKGEKMGMTIHATRGQGILRIILLSLLCASTTQLWAADTFKAALAAEYRQIGTVKPRHARDVQASNWSVGAETMDRDFTVYKNWREYLGPLGIKKARIQSGWAKTEKEAGKYDFAWLDEIVRDMTAQGVEPWICLCYGNPVYTPGHTPRLGDNPSTATAVRAAWLRYVGAVVDRYKDAVDEWELWNEPHGGAREAPDYTRFLIDTAETIRARQPKARIIGFVTAGIDIPLVKGGLEILKREGKLGLIDFVCYHPYNVNPDASYPRIGELRRAVNACDPRIRIWQGENGAPSTPGGFGAIAGYDWNEERQAKWALRRLLGDLGRDIPSSYFSICDMAYPGRVNFKGLLAINADKTVNHPKHSYAAVQRVAAIFDNRLRRIPDFTAELPPGGTAKTLSSFAYADREGRMVITLWKRDQPPADSKIEPADLTFLKAKFKNPVLVDMLGGGVFEIPAAQWSQTDSGCVFKGVPLYDSVVLIAERDLIPVKE